MRHLKMPTQTMRSFVLLFAFVVTLSFSTFAQSSLTGTIRFTIDEVCPGAEVKLTGPQQFSVLSNSNGAYSFNELTVAGRYMLSVGFLGYETFYKEFEISDQQIQEAAIIVIEHVFEEDTEMDDIIVQGWGKSGKPLEEEIVSVDVVNTQLIESNAIINASDAIERVPGIVIVDGQISVRGGGGYAYGTGSRVTLVIDDVPILTPERNEILWDFVPLETTDQIEVVKGSSSVQYGSSALNGIVHARTRWPERNSKAQTRIRTFSTFYDKAYQEDYRSAQWWQTPDTGNSFQSFPHSVGFSYYNGKHYAKRNLDVVFGAFATTDQTHIVEEFNHRIRGSVRMRWTPEKFDRFNMQLSVLSMYRHRSNIFIWNGDSSEILKPLANYRVRYQYAMIDPVLTYYLGEKRNQKLQLISRFYLDKALNGIGNRNNESYQIYNDLRYFNEFGNIFSFVGGITNRQMIVRANALRGFFPDGTNTFRYGELSGYGNLDVKLDRLVINSGFRFESYIIDEPTAQLINDTSINSDADSLNPQGRFLFSKPVFSIGANYSLSKRSNLRISFGQSFRVPSIAERFVDETLENTLRIRPNPTIRPEAGFSMEFGYKYHTTLKKTLNIYADAAIFYQSFTDMIEFQFGVDPTDPIPLGFQANNVSKARILGYELSLSSSGKIGKVPLNALIGYTYTFGGNAAVNEEYNRLGPLIRDAFGAYHISDLEQAEFQNGNIVQRENSILNGILNYRWRHLLKADVNTGYGKWTAGFVYRYYSYLDRIDEVFEIDVYPYTAAFGRYRENRQFKGEHILDLKTGFNFSEKTTLSFVAQNVFNRFIVIRPGKANPPRTYTLQATFEF